MKDRPYSWIYTAVLVLIGISIALTGSVAAQSTGYVDVAASDLPGDGSESTPYEISNVSELQAMEDDLDANYELVSDIDALNTVKFHNGRGFDPVGSFSESPAQPFRGSLNGNNNTITGLTINRPSDSGIGLFGFTGSEATITNLTLAGVNITGDVSVGGFVGANSGTVADARASGDVTGEEIVGGLVGFNNGTTANGIIRTARTSVSVIGGKGPVGGLVGVNRQGVIQTARASGSVTGDMGRSLSVGGLVGFNNGTVQTARASANVTGRNSVGGLVGQNGVPNNDVEIRDTFAAGSITGETAVGGLVGRNYATVEQSYFDTEATGQQTSAGGTALTTTEMTGSAAETNMAEFDFGSTWQTQPDSYPTLITLSSEGDGGEDGDSQDSTTGFVDVDAEELAGSGTSDNPYVITNASELQAMEDDLVAHYELGSDIDASGTTRWNSGKGFDPIGNTSSFRGRFNGNNHTITNLTINRQSEGLVGLVSYSSGSIADVKLKKYDMKGRIVGGVAARNSGKIKNVVSYGNIIGDNGIGAIAGLNQGAILNTKAQADIQAGLPVNSAYFVMSDNTSVGGLVGFNLNQGNIKRSSATGVITAPNIAGVGGLVGINRGMVSNSSTTTNVTGKNYVGGLVGFSEDSTIRDTYAAGKVSGSTNTSGFVGVVRSSTISDSYWDTEATGRSTSAGDAVGLTTAEMTGSTVRSSMSGLDFDTVWNTQAGGYPILAQQADNKSKQSGSAHVQLSNVSLTPQSVDLDSESTHKLTFDAYDVSNDGEKDEFEIEFPNRLNLIDSSDTTVSGISSTPQVNITGNTLRFTVNPSGTQSTRTLTIKMNITLSASDTTEETNTSSSQLPIPSDAEKVELTAQEREGLRNSLERGGEIDVENISELSVYSSNLQRDRESGGFVWFQNHKNVAQWEQNGTTGNAVLYRKEGTALFIGFFDGNPFDKVQNPQRDYYYTIEGPWDGLFV